MYLLLSKIILYGIINYYGLLLLYYWYHRLLHCKYSGFLYKIHYIGHHKTDFPLNNLHKICYSDSDNDSDNGWFKTGGELIFATPIILLLGCVYYLTSLFYFVNVVVVLLWIVISGEICHSSFHLVKNARSHPESLYIHKWLFNRKFFGGYVELHDIHHCKPNTNYGFLDMTMDKIFKTYCDTKPKYMITIENKIQKDKNIKR
jgi:sterol desaturase/sphingolipid hydroxylase (fatty acid hydroxylase superfamily)